MTKEKALEIAHKMLMKFSEGNTTYIGTLFNAKAESNEETYIFYLHQLQESINKLIDALKQ